MEVFSVILIFTIFFGSLALIFWKKIDRSIIAIAGSALMIDAGKIFDFNTFGLLLGMMFLVALLEPTGFFEYLAVLAARGRSTGANRHFGLIQ
ncbi:MAG: hypothetical protein JETCAE01_05260 [Anaerolineaceae bacterium]|nr:MAG: hypothetical protein JETCAE01_05260 [Anaerolineaceae bacterium]